MCFIAVNHNYGDNRLTSKIQKPMKCIEIHQLQRTNVTFLTPLSQMFLFSKSSLQWLTSVKSLTVELQSLHVFERHSNGKISLECIGNQVLLWVNNDILLSSYHSHYVAYWLMLAAPNVWGGWGHWHATCRWDLQQQFLAHSQYFWPPSPHSCLPPNK